MKTKAFRYALIPVFIIVLAAVAFLLKNSFSGLGSESMEPSQDEIIFSYGDGFYESAIKLRLSLNKGIEGSIYYTLDGNAPSNDSEKYSKKIELRPEGDDYPKGYCVRAQVVHTDGTVSEVYTHNYIISTSVKKRFSTSVICVTGAPEQLTDGPDGIFYGDNVDKRGKESERPIHLEMFDKTGNVILSQNCGVRPYGGASRHAFVKSMKFYARKEYDPQKKFVTDIFNTPKEYEEGNISEYKRLVLRNLGNDFNFAYIRDEFLQIEARKAGYADAEGVVPAVLYLNGKYNGLLWLHENYCDEYFKEKYGDKAKGEFAVIEGTELEKISDEPDAPTDEFNAGYNELIKLDLKDDENYSKVCEFIDVENYLDYYAYNLVVNNFDWPDNNVKCFRYYPVEDDRYSEGVFDGRWRFLLHDMDWSLGWDEFSVASYDNFADYFNTDSPYANSLIVHLLEREELKVYLKDKIEYLLDNIFESSSVLKDFDEVNGLRSKEQEYYQKWLEENEIYDEGDWGPDFDHYLNSMEAINVFLTQRPSYVKELVKKYLE